MRARRGEQIVTATLQRATILRVQVVHTKSVGATTNIYSVPSVSKWAHDRMHAMLGTHETDSQMPIRFEGLRRKIPTTLGARAVRKARHPYLPSRQSRQNFAQTNQ